MEFLQNNWREILALTREHLLLALLSTGLAVAAGIPLGILLTRVKSLRAPILGFANIMQTVPSLALFGLLIPLPFVGGIGARTAVIALAAYALLPVIRNTFTGILGVDPRAREAAEAMGMTSGQILRMVELPLALNVILTGARIATVISVGVATVAAAVGAGGLGTYIFRGLRQNDNNLLLAGAISAALLALLLDFLLGQTARIFEPGRRENAATERWRKIALGGATAVLAGVIALGFWSGGAPQSAAEKIAVGSKDFTESVILAEILAQMLEKKGVAVERKFELGGNLAHDALLAKELDVYPEYTGTAFTAILKNAPVTDPQIVYSRVKTAYAEKFALTVSPPLGFSNDFAILVRGDAARKQNLKNISDVAPLAAVWQTGFGQDFMSRADGYAGFVRAYGFNFKKQPREMDLSLTYRALAAGEVDVIAGNSTDGLIATLDLYQLADDRKYFPPYQAVFIARQEKADALAAVFRELENAISTADMRRLNYEVDGNKKTPKQAASEWLAAKNPQPILISPE
jgi:osmoprotectant transport system permease protein